MSRETISIKALRELIEANAIRSATVLGVPGGWVIEFRYGMTQKLLSTLTGSVKVYKDIRIVIDNLKQFGIVKFDVNSTDFDNSSLITKARERPDLSARLKKAHTEARNKKI